MVLRFEVNQAEAFRQGVDVEKSTNHLDVDPSKLSQEERNLIADRLIGIDVLRLEGNGDAVSRCPMGRIGDATRERIVAKLPTFEALMEAIRENEKAVRPAATTRAKGAK